MSAADKTKVNAIYRPLQGTALTNADQTVQPCTDKVGEYVQTTTLTVNRAKTLGVTSCTTGWLVRLVRADSGAFTFTVVNGGTNGGNLIVGAASPTETHGYTGVYNGADWVLVGDEALTAN